MSLADYRSPLIGRPRRVVFRRLVWIFAGLLSALTAGDGAAIETAGAMPESAAAGGGAQGLRLEHRLPLSWSAGISRGGRFREVSSPDIWLANRSGVDDFRRGLLPTRKDGPGSKPGSRTKLYWSAALVLTAGAVAYWSKSEADDAYDSYLRSAGSERQRDRFDRAEGYDRLSGAAFIAMEVGIALSTYLVFFGS